MSSVKVVCRVRPESEKEKAGPQDPDFRIDYAPDGSALSVWDSAGRVMQSFAFDRVFAPTGYTQRDVYEATGQDIIRGCFDGYNGCIFAYGQTGSGKTFSMFGKASEGNTDPELLGVIPRVAREMFAVVERGKEDLTYCEIRCSFLEIYMENIRDLLNPAASEKALQVHESKERGVFVSGLVEQAIESEQDIMDVISVGDRNRTFRSTAMNAHSSRSHSVLTVTIAQKYESGETKSGKLNLVDLAGSERLSRTLVGEEGKKEGIAINLSLSTLGLCIHALTVPGKFVPYRDSVLTRILKESLGGNSRTTLIVCASPHHSNGQDTISTLRFGSRAKDIKLKVKCNVQRSPAQLERLIAELQKEVRAVAAHNLRLERLADWVRSPAYDPAAPVPAEFLLPADDSDDAPSCGPAAPDDPAAPTSASASASASAAAPRPDLPATVAGLRAATAAAKERKAALAKRAQDDLQALTAAEAAAGDDVKRASADAVPASQRAAAARRTADEAESKLRAERERGERELGDLRRESADAAAQLSDLRAQNAELRESAAGDEDAIVALDADNERANEERAKGEALLAQARAKAEELLREAAGATAEAQQAAAALSKLQGEHAKLYELGTRAQRAIDASSGRSRAAEAELLSLRAAIETLEYRRREAKAFDDEYASAQKSAEAAAQSAAASLEQARAPLEKQATERRGLAVACLARALSGIAELRKASPAAAQALAGDEDTARRMLHELDPEYDLSKAPAPIPAEARARQLREALERTQAGAAACTALVTELQDKALEDLTRQAESAVASRTAFQKQARQAAEQAAKCAAQCAELEKKRKADLASQSEALARSAADAASGAAKAAKAYDPAEMASLLKRVEEQELLAARLRARSDEEMRLRREQRALADSLSFRLNELLQKKKQEEMNHEKAQTLLDRESKRANALAVELGVAEAAGKRAETRVREIKAEMERVAAAIANVEASLAPLLERHDAATERSRIEAEALKKAKEDLQEQQRLRLENLRRTSRIKKVVQRKTAGSAPAGDSNGLHAKVNISKLPNALRSTRSRLLQEAAKEDARSSTPRGEGMLGPGASPSKPQVSTSPVPK